MKKAAKNKSEIPLDRTRSQGYITPVTKDRTNEVNAATDIESKRLQRLVDIDMEDLDDLGEFFALDEQFSSIRIDGRIIYIDGVAEFRIADEFLMYERHARLVARIRQLDAELEAAAVEDEQDLANQYWTDVLEGRISMAEYLG